MKRIPVFLLVAVIAVGMVVGCGGDEGNANTNPEASANLGNSFDGRFLTIGYTPEFQVKEHEGGVTLEGKNGIKIEAICMPMKESKMGDLGSIDSVKSDIKSEISNYSEKEMKLGRHKALWIEGENDGYHGVAAFVPFDEWVLMAITDEPGKNDEDVELTRQIIRSLRVTNTDMPESIDFEPVEIETEPIEEDYEEEYPDTDQGDKEGVNDSKDGEYSASFKDEEGNEIDVNVSLPTEIEVGPNAMTLGKTYKGEFFTIKHPSSAEVNSFSTDEITTTMFEIDELFITVTGSKDTTAMSMGSIEDTTMVISGHNAVATRTTFNDSFVYNYAIEMDDWAIIINGTSEIDSEEYIDTFNAMVESFVITNDNYLD